MINIVVIEGRLTRAPEVKYIGTGTAIAEFSIAHSVYSKSKGEYAAQFYDCKAWGKFGEMLAGKYDKGDLVTVSGELDREEWDDKDGKRQYRIRIKVQSISQKPKKEAHDPDIPF